MMDKFNKSTHPLRKFGVYNNILETIGNTPLVKVNKITKDLPGEYYIKLETVNPGNSIKDRMA